MIAKNTVRHVNLSALRLIRGRTLYNRKRSNDEVCKFVKTGADHKICPFRISLERNDCKHNVMERGPPYGNVGPGWRLCEAGFWRRLLCRDYDA